MSLLAHSVASFGKGSTWNTANSLDEQTAPHARVGARTRPGGQDRADLPGAGRPDRRVRRHPPPCRRWWSGRGALGPQRRRYRRLPRPPAHRQTLQRVGDRLLALRGGAGGRKLGGFRLAGPVRPARGGVVAMAHTRSGVVAQRTFSTWRRHTKGHE